MKAITESGFECEIDEDLLDDYEILEDLCALDRGEVNILPETIKKILGEKQLAQLKEHVRNEKGKISTTALMTELNNILNGTKVGKNS